jgi:hypothetical protein
MTRDEVVNMIRSNSEGPYDGTLPEEWIRLDPPRPASDHRTREQLIAHAKAFEPAPQPEEIVYKPNSPHEWERGPQHVEPTSKIDDYLGTAIDRVQVDNLEAIAWALIAIAEELGGRK